VVNRRRTQSSLLVVSGAAAAQMESEADLRKRQKLEVKAQKAAANEAMLGKKGDERKKLERVHGDIGVALERRHMKEWQALEAATEAAAEGGSSAAGAEDAAAADGAGAELGAMSLGGGGVASSGSKKQPEVELDASGRPRRDGPSRADKKRKEKAAADAARERAVAEAAQGAPNLREEELNEIRRKLSPMGLTVREIAADGNCLYRAIADQLDLVTAGPPQGGPRGEQPYVAVRAMAAKFMRDHPGDFQPFLTLEGAGSPNDLYRAYCDKGK
jgi:hypothetical protein